MSLFDRLNRRLLARLRRHDPVIVVEHDAIRLRTPDRRERRLPFSAMTGAIVYHRDVYAADAIVLRLVFGPDGEVKIGQDDPQWDRLVAALDRSGRTRVASAVWQVESIADGPGAPPRDLIAR